VDYSSVPMAGLPLVGAMFGLCLGGPVGLLAGVKLGGVAAVGGSILGYTGASVIKEQKEMRTYIDDHYKNQPDLYVLTPREEAILNKRRLSERTPPDSPRHLPSLRRNGSSCRRGPAGYRSNYMESRSANSSPVSRRKFDPNSPVSRRKLDQSRGSPNLTRRNTYNLPSTPTRQAFETRQPPNLHMRQQSFEMRQPPNLHMRQQNCEMRQPPNLQMRQFRRLGDLSEDEQRSVVALISTQRCGPRDSRTYTVTAHVCDTAGSEHHNVVLHSASSNPPRPLDIRRKNFARQQKIRASSLPDVLEEDSLSNKS